MTTTATKSAEDRRTKADEAAEAARERQAKIAEIDTTFKDAVKAAADERAEALAELNEDFPSTNIAEQAWNETKAEADPLYADVAADFRQKLDVTVDTIKGTGNADEVGLEDFEARVKELLAEEDPNAETATKGKGALTTTNAKSGKLPDDFPHRQALADAGYDTYSKVRGLKGDYTNISGIGEAKSKDIDEAL